MHAHMAHQLLWSQVSHIMFRTQSYESKLSNKKFRHILDFDGKRAKKQVKVKVAQSCPNCLWPHGCSPPGSSVHGILQARMLECVVIPFSRGSSWPKLKPDPTHCHQILYRLGHQGSPGSWFISGISRSWQKKRKWNFPLTMDQMLHYCFCAFSKSLLRPEHLDYLYFNSSAILNWSK